MSEAQWQDIFGFACIMYYAITGKDICRKWYSEFPEMWATKKSDYCVNIYLDNIDMVGWERKYFNFIDNVFHSKCTIANTPYTSLLSTPPAERTRLKDDPKTLLNALIDEL